MNKHLITALIFLAVLVVLVLLSFRFINTASASAQTVTPNPNGEYTPPPVGTSLLNIPAQAGKTTVIAYVQQESGNINYTLTYTNPTTTTPSGKQATAISKELSVNGYLSFVNDYPTGIADGNVMENYN